MARLSARYLFFWGREWERHTHTHYTCYIDYSEASLFLFPDTQVDNINNKH